jgi:hypothetical protein
LNGLPLVAAVVPSEAIALNGHLGGLPGKIRKGLSMAQGTAEAVADSIKGVVLIDLVLLTGQEAMKIVLLKGIFPRNISFQARLVLLNRLKATMPVRHSASHRLPAIAKVLGVILKEIKTQR